MERTQCYPRCCALGPLPLPVPMPRRRSTMVVHLAWCRRCERCSGRGSSHAHDPTLPTVRTGLVVSRGCH
nr:MAG TPA: hypothetical protein [Caudoviricetes sp.]